MNTTQIFQSSLLVVPLEEAARSSAVRGEDISRYGALGLISPAQSGAGAELYFTEDLPLVSLLRLLEVQGSPAAELRRIAQDIKAAWGTREDLVRSELATRLANTTGNGQAGVADDDARESRALWRVLQDFGWVGGMA